MPRILLVDDDPETDNVTARLLRSYGYDVRTTFTGEEGLRCAAIYLPQIALVDLRLPGMPGLEVIAQLRQVVPLVRAALVTGYRTLEVMLAAAEHRAIVVAKPLFGDDLLQLVDRLAASVEHDEDCGADDCEAHAVSRWADMVIRAIGSPKDPRTLKEWGRAVGASEGAIRNWCHTARLRARESLRFTRVLRAVIRHEASGAPPEDLLDIVDTRSLAKLLVASGGSREHLPVTLEDFLSQQQLIADDRAMSEIGKRLVSPTVQMV